MSERIPQIPITYFEQEEPDLYDEKGGEMFCASLAYLQQLVRDAVGDLAIKESEADQLGDELDLDLGQLEYDILFQLAHGRFVKPGQRIECEGIYCSENGKKMKFDQVKSDECIVGTIWKANLDLIPDSRHLSTPAGEERVLIPSVMIEVKDAVLYTYDPANNSFTGRKALKGVSFPLCYGTTLLSLVPYTPSRSVIEINLDEFPDTYENPIDEKTCHGTSLVEEVAA